MPDPEVPIRPVTQRERALSRWENEGGADEPLARALRAAAPVMTNTELAHLHIRVIALENILLAVLSEGSERQIQVAHDMADMISPRQGATSHPLTIQAAKHMTDLIGRAKHFQSASS